jgi:ketosteroid isomerase-like protein
MLKGGSLFSTATCQAGAPNAGFGERLRGYVALFPVFWLGILLEDGLRRAETGALQGWLVNELDPNLRLQRYVARGLAWPALDPTRRTRPIAARVPARRFSWSNTAWRRGDDQLGHLAHARNGGLRRPYLRINPTTGGPLPMSSALTDRTAVNLATVSDIYAAFGRGEVPTILDKIAPNCRWESWANNRAQNQGVPTLQPRTGPAGVAEFFAAVGELQIHDFQVLDIVAGERQVAVEAVIDFSTPAGGRSRDEECHLWTFDEHHQVVRLRHYDDTATHIAAFAGEDTTVPAG